MSSFYAINFVKYHTFQSVCKTFKGQRPPCQKVYKKKATDELRLNTPYLRGTRSDNWRKIINWSYHDVIVAKISFGPLTVQLHSAEDDYLGSVIIGFTKEIRSKLNVMTPPFSVSVKSRGWTSGGKLRLPQIVEIKY